MSLTDRYIHAVTKQLPSSSRAEVAEELRATIQDTAAGRSQQAEPTAGDIRAALHELGDPTLLARQYSNVPRYLIGPRWYDLYLTMLKHVLSVVPALVTAIVFVVHVIDEPAAIIAAVLNGVGTGITVAIHLIFWTTLIFVWLERSANRPADLMGQAAKPWTPDDLPPVPKARQIGRVESATSAAFMLIGIGWVATLPFWYTKDGASLINPVVWQWAVPLFFILSLLSVTHRLWQFRVGNWTAPLVITHIILTSATAIYLLALISGPEIVNPTYIQAWQAEGATAEIGNIIRWSVSISIAVAIVSSVWEAVQSVVMHRRLSRSSAAVRPSAS